MGIPALSMMTDLASSLATGKVPPNLANNLTSSISHMSGAALFGSLVFGGIGTIAFVYGKKRMNVKNMLIGALLVGYTFLVTSTLLTYSIGIALCVALYLTREKDNAFTSMD